MPGPNTEYKDRLFSFLFGQEENKAWTLSLYNAVNGSAYTDPDLIEITTIREVLYLGMRNDVSFMISDEMNMYEQQSTYNPNMPLRMLQYAASLFERYIANQKRSKYGKRLIHLPTPRLVVFYNGTDDKPDETILRLSDAFTPNQREEADIEVKVRMININDGNQPAILGACKPLQEYTWVVEQIRSLRETESLEEAISHTIEIMPDDFLIKPYLDVHKAEVKGMLLTEYNEAEEMSRLGQEYYEEGRSEGKAQGESKLGHLIARLFALGRIEDAGKAAIDPQVRERLYAELQIV